MSQNNNVRFWHKQTFMTFKIGTVLPAPPPFYASKSTDNAMLATRSSRRSDGGTTILAVVSRVTGA